MSYRAAALIPAYNCEATIADVVRRTLPLVDSVLVVSDGSTDATAWEALNAGAQVLSLKENQGKGRAIRKGLGVLLKQPVDGAVFLDGDGQHPPEKIPEFIEKAHRCDMVIGVRDLGGDHVPRKNRRTNRFFGGLFLKAWTGWDLPDYQCGFRLVAAHLLRRMPPVFSKYAVESQMLVLAAKLKARVDFVHLEAIYASGGSHFRPVADTFHICMASLYTHYVIPPLSHPLDPLSFLQ